MKSYIVILTKIMIRKERKFGIIVAVISFYIGGLISVGLVALLKIMETFFGVNGFISVIIAYIVFSPSLFLSLVSMLLVADEVIGYTFKRGLFYAKPGKFKSELTLFVGE